ncbi:oligoendopeptidase F [Niveispirillum lacus]|uniref:Oligopeptidase F n=1 Tax=Niveispirillum lacus TaxID=1981099 RepID=A0A255Z8Q8_9PROT|nr:oligoendopeptidase F [Niveispirillum lacus]OYQ37265.1 oligoendopeptidase F [Niveispirillum lacus]
MKQPIHRPLVARLLGASAIALVTALAPLGTASAQDAKPAASTPAQVDPRHVWDVTPLFADDAAWDAARKQALADLPALEALKGTLGKDAATLRAGLDRMSQVGHRVEKVLVYAYLHYSTDTRNDAYQERWSLAQALSAQAQAATAWLSPEIQAVGAEKIGAFIQADAGLAKHAFRLNDMLRLKAHTLTPETEAALAAYGPVLSAASNTYSALANADIDWPELTLPDGTTRKVNQSGYQSLRQHADRAVRKAVFDSFWTKFGQYATTMGNTLSAAVQTGTIDAKLRGYPTAVAASLASNDIPETVYRTLVAEANKGLPTLHRYFKLRQKMLKLPDLHYYDIYPSVVELDKKFTLDQSRTLTLAAVKPLGKDYVDLLADLTAKRTMHVYPSEGKDSGAYHWGTYGVHPYVFLNHQDDYNSMSTYAHEWGHGMHSALAQKAQPYELAGYSLFMAEIASTTNEMLLTDYLVSKAKTKQEKLFYLGQSLENLRGTFFRQTMFAEFELATHDAVERGEALSGSKMKDIYCGLLKKYHGDAEGVMKIDEKYCAEWAFIPHFYRPFYVYQYATSISAGTYFAEQISKGGTKARDNYLNVLKAGGSEYPYPLLKKAGLDMATSAPYQALVRRMDATMDQMEKLLAE